MKQILVITLFFSWIMNSFGQEEEIHDDLRKIRIPVVFHIIFSRDDENIDDSLIENELNNARLDFTCKNDMSLLDDSVNNLVGNPNIEFYLLDTMLQKFGTKGIRRIKANRNLSYGSLFINKDNCINVFVINDGSASDILSDRINLYYGNIGQNTHVLTHEIGHWLGLYHIWGQIGGYNKFQLIFGNHDDKIDDTPAQWSCTDKTFKGSCPPAKNLYYKGKKVLYNNFMDYSNCRCMFTIDQAACMRKNIIKFKPLLFTAT